MIKPTILIIDDSEDEVLLTKTVLSRISQDIRAEVAFSGHEGLMHLQQGKTMPKLVLLDLKMPLMDGIEVLHRIRCEEGTACLPVIIVTNSDLESDRQAAIEAGANGYLHKSCDLQQFRKDLAIGIQCWINAKNPQG